MQSRRTRPQSRNGHLEEMRRTSDSTASRESSLAPGSQYEADPRIVLSRPQSQLSQAHYAHAPGGFGPYHQHVEGPITMPVQYQQHYSQPTHIDQSMAFQQYGQLQGEQASAYYSPIDHYNETPSFGVIGQMTRTGTPQLPSGPDMNDRKDKKNATTTAANEKELRELLDKNETKTLDDIARDVRQAERTQKSERAKQLFAMRWLREFCKHDTDSVPRNRVYTHYAQRCGTDRVDTLNPASFGKLVRIIFPGIQTRRLGVRGESKYHYVNLKLLDDPQATVGRSYPPSANLHERAGSFDVEQDYSTISRMPTDTATFPSQEQPLPITSSIPLQQAPVSRGQLFAHPTQPGFQQPQDEPQMFTQLIKFSPSAELAHQDEAMNLPDIGQFAPEGTDPDLANALFALYRTHCTSLVDAIRYVRQKSFFRQLSSFNGTLTVPVSKLFASPNVAEWINRCDWHMYQQIVRFISQLALQVIPQPVFLLLKEISDTLTDTIRKNFSHHPHHVLQAKIGPATVFASLLTRLLRVNESAHAAATFLTNDTVRTLMWQDWAEHVHPKRVIESELPNCGYEEVYNILTHGMRQLLEPFENHTQQRDVGIDFQPVVAAASLNPVPPPTDETGAIVLDRWAVFLKTLPDRFPNAPTRMMLHTINAVGSAALRDITVAQAQSFGSWWITKVWVDEMMLWLAEMGGFLEGQQTSTTVSPPDLGRSQSSAVSNGSIGSGVNGAESAGLGLDFQPDLTSSMTAPMKNGVGNNNPNMNHAASYQTKPGMRSADNLSFSLHDHFLDDSGIGMSLMGDENDNSSFTYMPMNNDGLSLPTGP